jgi:16S rRNA (cytosine1402-N4)-methyltransferase
MVSHDILSRHVTVLREEAVELLQPEQGSVFIDATLGLGGHTELILQRNSKARVIGIDQDVEALAVAKERLGELASRVTFVHGNFSEIKRLAAENDVPEIDGIIADLGVSSMQVDSEERGFSFRFDAPLDMRMDTDSGGETAAELLERLSEEEIANIIYRYGEERASRKIARRIVSARNSGKPIATTFELKKLVESCVRSSPKTQIHPATRTFQALRIAVNSELDILEQFLKDSVEMLRSGGRLAVISFHSLEDRIVKQTFLRLSGRCECPPRMPVCICGAEKLGNILTRKPLVPVEEEIARNPRARSAKLRAIEKA